MGEEQQRERWADHFKELLNTPVPPNPADILSAVEELDIECGTPTNDEIRKAIRQQRNGKAAGPESIPCKALREDIETTVDVLYPFQEDLGRGRGTLDRKEGYLIKLPKER